jgi:hypothetical protein
MTANSPRPPATRRSSKPGRRVAGFGKATVIHRFGDCPGLVEAVIAPAVARRLGRSGFRGSPASVPSVGGGCRGVWPTGSWSARCRCSRRWRRSRCARPRWARGGPEAEHERHGEHDDETDSARIMLAITWPVSTEARAMAMVRNRSMMPVVMSHGHRDRGALRAARCWTDLPDARRQDLRLAVIGDLRALRWDTSFRGLRRHGRQSRVNCAG